MTLAEWFMYWAIGFVVCLAVIIVVLRFLQLHDPNDKVRKMTHAQIGPPALICAVCWPLMFVWGAWVGLCFLVGRLAKVSRAHEVPVAELQHRELKVKQ